MVTKKTMKWTIIVLWIVCAVILAVFLSACGSSTTYETVETIEPNSTIEEPSYVPGGLAIIVEESENSAVTVDENIITIDCGGSCGDITIGIPITE